MSREDIIDAILDERNYQETRWGNEYDDEHTLEDWTSFIDQYNYGIGKAEYLENDPRTRMIAVAALAIAAIEAMDRRDEDACCHCEDCDDDEYDSVDISSEEYRVYYVPGQPPYQIDNPRWLWVLEDGIDQIEDAEGSTHILPSPGNNGCILKCKEREAPCESETCG